MTKMALINKLYNKVSKVEKDIAQIKHMIEDRNMSEEDIAELQEALAAHKRGKTKPLREILAEKT